MQITFMASTILAGQTTALAPCLCSDEIVLDYKLQVNSEVLGYLKFKQGERGKKKKVKKSVMK